MLWIGVAALIALPFAVRVAGLSTNTATQVVCLAIAVLGLNMLVGFTGLTSFGHSAWFGIGAYAAAISQKQWFAGRSPRRFSSRSPWSRRSPASPAPSFCAGAASTSRF